MEIEIWKDVPDYGNLYQASNLGRVKVKQRTVNKFHKCGKFITQNYQEKTYMPKPDLNGYKRIHISVNHTKHKIFEHTFVLLAFVGKKPIGYEACHGDNNPSNNRVENLRWDSHFNNNQDRKRSGNYATGKDHPMWKNKEELIKRGKQHGE